MTTILVIFVDTGAWFASFVAPDPALRRPAPGSTPRRTPW
jgi:hypothetical protein